MITKAVAAELERVINELAFATKHKPVPLDFRASCRGLEGCVRVSLQGEKPLGFCMISDVRDVKTLGASLIQYLDTQIKHIEEAKTLVARLTEE